MKQSKTSAVATEERSGAEELLEKGQMEAAELGALAKLPPFGPVAVSLMRLFGR